MIKFTALVSDNLRGLARLTKKGQLQSRIGRKNEESSKIKAEGQENYSHLSVNYGTNFYAFASSRAETNLILLLVKSQYTYTSCSCIS